MFLPPVGVDGAESTDRRSSHDANGDAIRTDTCLLEPVTTYFVTRHPGATEWAIAHGLHVDETVAHLDARAVEPGDIVVGSLPVNLAAEVCRRGGRYLHLSLVLPLDERGRELTADQMHEFGARIDEYRIELVGGLSREPSHPLI